MNSGTGEAEDGCWSSWTCWLYAVPKHASLCCFIGMHLALVDVSPPPLAPAHNLPATATASASICPLSLVVAACWFGSVRLFLQRRTLLQLSRLHSSVCLSASLRRHGVASIAAAGQPLHTPVTCLPPCSEWSVARQRLTSTTSLLFCI